MSGHTRWEVRASLPLHRWRRVPLSWRRTKFASARKSDRLSRPGYCQLEAVSQTKEKDVGVAIVVGHNAMPENTSVEPIKAPVLQRSRAECRRNDPGNMSSRARCVFIDGSVTAESGPDRPGAGVKTWLRPDLADEAVAADQLSITFV
jgi:hypothetical protein